MKENYALTIIIQEIERIKVETDYRGTTQEDMYKLLDLELARRILIRNRA